jgi:Sulfotransferase domain/Tetratricopeptide repeat
MRPSPQTPPEATADTAPGVRPLEPREQQAIALMQAGALAQAEAIFKDVLSDRPDDHQIMNALAILAAQQGRIRDAIDMFERALRHAPGDGGPTDNTPAIVQNMAMAAFALLEQQDWPGALAAYRTILAADPEHASAPNTIIHCVMATGDTPRLADFAPGLDERELGKHAFIACMPKSGSTFLKMVLCALTGWPEAILTYAFLQNEEELYLPFLRKAARNDTVTQLHVRATVPNLQMMRAFKIRPIVLVRNLFDVVVSYADFFDTGAKVNTFFAGRWDGLSRARKLDLVIDNFVPWYNAFYASWSDVMKHEVLDCRLVRYADMIADKQGTLESLAAFYDLGKSADECAAAIERVDGRKDITRFNKGKAGRGAEELSDAQRDRIRHLAGYYPDIDFGPLGL